MSMKSGLTPPFPLRLTGALASYSRLTEIEAYSNTVNYVYDAAGNVTNDGAHTYQYDAENRLVMVDNGATAQYWYDHQNRRIVKLLGGSKTDCIWDGNQMVEEHDGNASTPGAPLVRYVYVSGRMLAKIAGGVTRYYLSDRLSARLVLDSSGNVVGRMAHLPFGEDFGESGEQDKHHFTSYERDGESVTDYAVNRQYSQSIGRFSRPDPLRNGCDSGNPQKWNRYDYTINDPANKVDPSGLDFLGSNDGWAYWSGVFNVLFAAMWGAFDPGKHGPLLDTGLEDADPFGNGGIRIAISVYKRDRVDPVIGGIVAVHYKPWCPDSRASCLESELIVITNDPRPYLQPDHLYAISTGLYIKALGFEGCTPLELTRYSASPEYCT